MTTISRRALLQLAVSAPALALIQRTAGLDLSAFARASWRAISSDGSAAPASVHVTRAWRDERCRSEIVNNGSTPVALKEVVLFDVPHTLPSETPLYGEGFQMLSQTGGTLAAVTDLGNYTDLKHYKMAEPPGARVVHNLLTLAATGSHHVLAFTSCDRFSGTFHLRAHTIDVVLDLEGLSIGPGETWRLEEFAFHSGPDRVALLAAVATRLGEHHKALTFAAPPSGWCSWYCFGPSGGTTPMP